MPRAALLPPVTIDFEGIGLGGDNPILGGVPLHSEDGFTIVDPADGSERAFLFWRPAADPFLGTVALWNGTVGGVTLLTQDNGALFDLTSIDLSEDQNRSGSHVWTIDFAGAKEDGTTVTASFTLDGVLGLERFAPTGLTDLVSLEWVSSLPVQFDNIVLVPHEPAPPPPVPSLFVGELTVDRARLNEKGNRQGLPDHTFTVMGTFTRAPSSDGIDPMSEAVRVTFGPFVWLADETTERRVEGRGWRLRDDMVTLGLDFDGDFSLRDAHLNLGGINPPAALSIAIRVGNDIAATAITLDAQGKFKR